MQRTLDRSHPVARPAIVTAALLVLGASAASCGGAPGNAGPFAGLWTGTITATTNQTSPSMAMRTSMDTGAIEIEGSYANGVDFVARIAGEDCVFNFVRNGNSATLMAGSTCTLDSQTSTTLMGTTQMNSSNAMLTMLNGTATVNGAMLSMTVNFSLNATTTMMGMTNVVQQTVMLSFAGAHR